MSATKTSTDPLPGYWVCMGIPPATPPCGAGGSGTQAGADKAAAKHTKDTDHSTMTSTRRLPR